MEVGSGRSVQVSGIYRIEEVKHPNSWLEVLRDFFTGFGKATPSSLSHHWEAVAFFLATYVIFLVFQMEVVRFSHHFWRAASQDWESLIASDLTGLEQPRSLTSPPPFPGIFQVSPLSTISCPKRAYKWIF